MCVSILKQSLNVTECALSNEPALNQPLYLANTELTFQFFTLIIVWALSDESDRSNYQQQFSVPLPSFTMPDTVHGTFNEFTSRTTRIVPLALAILRAQTTNVTNKLKLLFDLNWNWLPSLWHGHNMPHTKVPLSADEYQRMLSHINAYIDTIVDKKIQSIERELHIAPNDLDPKIALFVANIVKEQIIEHKYVLSDADIEHIANIVREKLSQDAEKSKGIPLTQANLEEISRLIQEQIETRHREWVSQGSANEKTTTQNISPEKFDVQEILYKILTSGELTEFVDKRFDVKAKVFSSQLSGHQSSIDTLRSDINELKEQLKSAFVLNSATKQSIETLHTEHGQLDERIAKIDTAHTDQFNKLLESIDVKLNAFNDKQFSAIDIHIRNTLVDIFGYRTSDGTPLTNDDLTNWVQSIFVAKDLLQTRLNELNSKLDHRLDDEINQMAEMVIRNVSETIKRDIAIEIEKTNSEQRLKTEHSEYGSYDETHIQLLIQKALAIYDADKTGMVDYALESSGGEVLSTRYYCTSINSFHLFA